ncbi:hypothetical protein AB0K51_09405 [Kitasatospora sp. NPDC049285]|uniref:hypothetical protein n=1 Tax=Kitasatospora sp. NPDC049285 TaxID=3157096 RepID=UPI0034324426
MTTIIEPPAAAVAADAHWRAKMARLRARKLPERTVRICDDDEAKLAVTDAQLKLAKALAEARTTAAANDVDAGQVDSYVESQPLVVIARSLLATAEQRLSDATIAVTFRALPRPVWEALLAEHPPTEEQAEQNMDYNVLTFPAALIAASHVERDEAGTEVDGMSVEDAQLLLDEWADADAKVLFTGAMLVNQHTRADLGKG